MVRAALMQLGQTGIIIQRVGSIPFVQIMAFAASLPHVGKYWQRKAGWMFMTIFDIMRLPFVG
jgi:hypothetical protein